MPDELLLGMGVGAVICLISILTKGKIGLGDGAVLMLSGLFLGFPENMELGITAAYLAGMAALFLLIFKKRKGSYSMPFVPFIFLAYVWRVLM